MFADIGIGIILSILISWFFSIELSPFFIVMGIFFVLLPDIDMLVYLFSPLKKIFKGHREITHYPIIYLPFILIIFVIFGSVWGFLSMLGIFFHLVHDTLWIGHGIKWLWPFSQKSFKFFPQEKYMKSGEHWITTFYLRVNPVTVIEYSVFLGSLIFLFIYLHIT